MAGDLQKKEDVCSELTQGDEESDEVYQARKDAEIKKRKDEAKKPHTDGSSGLWPTGVVCKEQDPDSKLTLLEWLINNKAANECVLFYNEDTKNLDYSCFRYNYCAPKMNCRWPHAEDVLDKFCKQQEKDGKTVVICWKRMLLDKIRQRFHLLL